MTSFSFLEYFWCIWIRCQCCQLCVLWENSIIFACELEVSSKFVLVGQGVFLKLFWSNLTNSTKFRRFILYHGSHGNLSISKSLVCWFSLMMNCLSLTGFHVSNCTNKFNEDLVESCRILPNLMSLKLPQSEPLIVVDSYMGGSSWKPFKLKKTVTLTKTLMTPFRQSISISDSAWFSDITELLRFTDSSKIQSSEITISLRSHWALALWKKC